MNCSQFRHTKNLDDFSVANKLSGTVDTPGLKKLLQEKNPEFWPRLATATREAAGFDELFRLSTLRKKGRSLQIPKPGNASKPIRLAITGSYSFYPLGDLLEHLCEMEGFPCELWLGSFDNYISEIMDAGSELHAFKPEVVLWMPSERRCKYTGKLTDPREMQEAEAAKFTQTLLDLARQLYAGTNAEIILTNFIPPARRDPGAYRVRTLGSEWSFRKRVNLALGLDAPPYLHVCDLEFLAYRMGGLRARDDRAWFETKQPCSPEMLAELARETVRIIAALKRAPKKVLVLDLDNTLWGGIVGDDGLEGIEIGDTSPRGEAFKAFQNCIASLKERGVLLAVASKNDEARAREVFEKHPEMVLRMDDFVSFKVNWEPKSENIRAMAQELNLGPDSFVFVDDNPAEIEIVKQFVPEVSTILLGADPSEYAGQLLDSRYFEPRAITEEDAERTGQYRSEAQRKALQATITDMGAYLESLEMEGEVRNFTAVDVPRLAQLINKSNQFNLTTRRRTEADLQALMRDTAHSCFSFRLKDKFGDHGLISVIIARQEEKALVIDTWLMSCRVLKRQVEDAVLNEILLRAADRGCEKITGEYLPTSKNGMVRDFYPQMGFQLTGEDQSGSKFELSVPGCEPHPTKIKITRPNL